MAGRSGGRAARRRELRRGERRGSPPRCTACWPTGTRQTVLIVSHVTPIKTLVAAALLAPPPALYRMHLDVAALCEIDWYADGPAVLRSFNDTGHLRPAKERRRVMAG